MSLRGDRFGAVGRARGRSGAVGRARGRFGALAGLLWALAGPGGAATAATAATAAPTPGLFGVPDPSPPPAAAPGTPAAELLRALVVHSRLALPLVDGRLAGPGGDRWRALAGPAAHVVFGEQHGNAGIAAVAQAMWNDLRDAGWRHAALEVDPYVMSSFVDAHRQGGLAGWARFLADRGGSPSVPFLGWAEEARLAATVPEALAIDQVFVGIAPWLLKDLLQQPDAGLSPDGRAAVMQWLAAPGGPTLGRTATDLLARAATTSRPGSAAHTLLEALQASAGIYAPFVGAAGEATLSNARREQMMKRQFLQGVRHAATHGRPSPRVFVKVGAYHAFRGGTPTGVQGLGGFVTELAAAEERNVLTVLVLCGPGSQAAAHDGAPQPCDSTAAPGDWAFLRPWIDEREPTLFDLRSWRLRLRRLQGLPAEVQRAVASFDLLVVVPAAPAATPLVP